MLANYSRKIQKTLDFWAKSQKFLQFWLRFCSKIKGFLNFAAVINAGSLPRITSFRRTQENSSKRRENPFSTLTDTFQSISFSALSHLIYSQLFLLVHLPTFWSKEKHFSTLSQRNIECKTFGELSDRRKIWMETFSALSSFSALWKIYRVF